MHRLSRSQLGGQARPSESLMIMNAKILCLAALTFTTPAFAQSASEYLSKVFNGSAIIETDRKSDVDSGKASCDELRLKSGRHSLIIPTRSVQIALFSGSSDGVRFSCINGGGCIQWTGSHGVNWIILNGFTQDITRSISKAFGVLQESCGGAETRPF